MFVRMTDRKTHVSNGYATFHNEDKQKQAMISVQTSSEYASLLRSGNVPIGDSGKSHDEDEKKKDELPASLSLVCALLLLLSFPFSFSILKEKKMRRYLFCFC